MLDGFVTFHDFGVGGCCSDLRASACAGMSPVVFHLDEDGDDLAAEAKQYHLKTLKDFGLHGSETSFYDPYLAEQPVASVESNVEVEDTWILFDLGAAANGCPPDFAPGYPLLPLGRKVPSFKSDLWWETCCM